MGRRVGYAQPTKAGSINAAGIKIGKIVRHQRCSFASSDTLPPRSYQPLERFTIQTTESITGTSISTPTTVASAAPERSEEHTSELQSLMRISYAVFCLKKKKQK